jgi:hypothetical protein
MAVPLLIGQYACVFRRRRRGSERGDPSSGQTYHDLRAMALSAVDRGVLPVPPAEHPDVWGVVIDIPRSGGTATLVALTDNTTSLYTSTGGGTIGAGEHGAVAQASHRLLASVQRHLDAFTGTDDDGALPVEGSVRFHVLCPGAKRMTDVPEDAFWGRANHPLTPVIAAAQGVISSMRKVGPPSA